MSDRLGGHGSVDSRNEYPKDEDAFEFINPAADDVAHPDDQECDDEGPLLSDERPTDLAIQLDANDAEWQGHLHNPAENKRLGDTGVVIRYGVSAAQRRDEERKERASRKAKAAREARLRRRANRAWRVGIKPGYPSLAKRLASCEAAAAELSALIAYPSDHNSKMYAVLVDGFDTSAARESVLDWPMQGENQTYRRALEAARKEGWRRRDNGNEVYSDTAAKNLILKVERAIWRPVNKLRGQWFRQREIAEAWLRAVETWHRHRDALLGWGARQNFGSHWVTVLAREIVRQSRTGSAPSLPISTTWQGERCTVVPPPSKTQRMVREVLKGHTPDEAEISSRQLEAKHEKRRAKHRERPARRKRKREHK